MLTSIFLDGIENFGGAKCLLIHFVEANIVTIQAWCKSVFACLEIRF